MDITTSGILESGRVVASVQYVSMYIDAAHVDMGLPACGVRRYGRPNVSDACAPADLASTSPGHEPSMAQSARRPFATR